MLVLIICSFVWYSTAGVHDHFSVLGEGLFSFYALVQPNVR